MNNQPAPSSVDQTPSLVRVASDELLLLGSRLHDDVALGVLYDRYGTEVYALALETLRQSDAAEAVLQDVFLRCWRGVEIYDTSHGTTHDWLLGITRSRALDALSRLEPFGGVPGLGLRDDDTGLLGPAEPSSGARDRLLARARSEGGGARAADAPTVVIPAAELGPEPELASEAPTLTDLPILGPVLAAVEPEILLAERVTAPTEPCAAPEEPVTVSAEPVTASDEPLGAPDEAMTVSAEPVTAPDEEPVVAEAATTPDDVMESDHAVEDEQAPPGAQSVEVPPSEALAAALAPIPPRRQQPRRVVAEAPRRGGIKLASIFWAVALLFVVASGLFVTAWSATGPHLSPDLAVLSRLPGGRVLTLRGTGMPTASARIHSADSGRRGELAADGLPPLPNGRVYQVWMVEPGQPARSAGAFYISRKGDAVVPLSLGGPVERLQLIFVSQEPAPGTTAPTGLRLLEWTP